MGAENLSINYHKFAAPLECKTDYHTPCSAAYKAEEYDTLPAGAKGMECMACPNLRSGITVPTQNAKDKLAPMPDINPTYNSKAPPSASTEAPPPSESTTKASTKASTEASTEASTKASTSNLVIENAA